VKQTLVAFFTAIFVAAVFLAVAAAADVPAGPIKITNFGKKSAVTFKHSDHTDLVACKSCHHKKAGGNSKCANPGCHGAEAAGAIPSLKDAAHMKDKGKCWACHFPTAPKPKAKLTCNECHK